MEETSRTDAAPGSPRRLLLCGGGPLPADALSLFGSWTGPGGGSVLVLAWGSRFPDEAFERSAIALCDGGIARAEGSLRPPRSESDRESLLETLGRASAVFFTGGDQTRIMDGLDAGLAAAFRARYAAGVPFAGTSAGTAIMSPLMIAGSHDPRRLDASCVVTRTGLGLLEGTIVDQHFLRRRRQNRLFALLLEREGTLGLGVDEGAALAVEDGAHGVAFGGQVLVASARDGELKASVLEPGEGVSITASFQVRRAPVLDAHDGTPAFETRTSLE